MKTSNQTTDLVELLTWREQHQGERPAFTFLGPDLSAQGADTYSSFAAAARRVAARLADFDARGRPVMLACPPGMDFVRALWGILMAGGIAVPAYPPTNAIRARHFAAIANDCQPRIVLGSETARAMFAELEPEMARRLSWLLPPDEQEPSGAAFDVSPLNPNAPAILQYTSGSTGRPNGVILTHRNILANSWAIQRAFVHTSKSRGLIWLPPYHDMGLIGGIFQPVYAGFHTWLLSPRTFLRNPFLWIKAISDTRATTSGAPNFAYRACLGIADSVLEEHEINLRSWQVAFNGAEAVDGDTLSAFTAKFRRFGFIDRRFTACYGLAEATLHVASSFKNRRPTLLSVDRDALQRRQVEVRFTGHLGSQSLVGHGYAGEAVRIVDPETRQVCPPNGVGEIWVAGDHVSPGYWANEEATRQAFGATLNGHPRPYLRTGDLGFIHGGELYVTGRIKDVIVIRGRNHFPEDLEKTAQEAHPHIAGMSGAAFATSAGARATSSGQERLVLVQEVPRRTVPASDHQQIIEAVRIAVTRAHGVSLTDILLVPTGSIPRTLSGKVRRHACMERFARKELASLAAWHAVAPAPQGESGAAGPAVSPRVRLDVAGLSPEGARIAIRDWMMRKTAAALQLPIQEISPDMHFGLYGIDSMMAVELTLELTESLQLPLEDTVFWDYPNFNLLSRHLAERWAAREGMNARF
jgi:acyl-CoA synthetase (AMP-forming)/AMP-acid ligase II/acyl carrier protein